MRESDSLATSLNSGDRGDDPKRRVPLGVWVLLVAETLLRFGFFGLVGIFVDVAKSTYALGEPESRLWFHLFYAASWLCCILGGYLYDRLARVPTILTGGLLFAAGLGLVIEDRRNILIGLALVAAGFGCMKPTIMTLLGDQFGPEQKELRAKFLARTYVATNLGAFFGLWLIPASRSTLNDTGTFIILGISGLLATGAIALYSRRFLSVSSVMGSAALRLRSPAISGICLLCLSMFWALYNQTHSSVVQMARDMAGGVDGHLALFRLSLKPAQFQMLNPLFVILLTPAFRGMYSGGDEKAQRERNRGKMIASYAVLVLFMLCTLLAQVLINQKASPGSGWLVATYLLASIAELLFVFPALPFFYSLTLENRGLSMGLFFATIGLGELISAMINLGWARFNLDTSFGRLGYFVVLAVLGIITWAAFARYSRRAITDPESG